MDFLEKKIKAKYVCFFLSEVLDVILKRKGFHIFAHEKNSINIPETNLLG